MRRFLFGIMLLALAAGCVYQQPEGKNIGVGDKIPAFDIVMEDGSSLSSEHLLGAPALLIFFHTTCPDCQRTLPVVQQAYERFGKEVRFVAISRGEGQADVRQWWNANGITLPFSAQQDSRVYELFATSRIPRVYVVDGKGIVRAAYDGNPCPEYAQLEKGLRALLK